MIKFLHDYSEHILSYLAAAMAFVISLPLMKIGGAILLISRLIVDVPPAAKKVRGYFFN
jgi:hypothetical protein